MDTAGRKYPAKRSFKFAIPHLRFGSGVRFDLANSFKEDEVKWEIEFFYGNFKKIKRLPLYESVHPSHKAVKPRTAASSFVLSILFFGIPG